MLLAAESSVGAGFITLKVDILDRKFALANPMEELLPPQKDMFELRVIIWEVRGLAVSLSRQSKVDYMQVH